MSILTKDSTLLELRNFLASIPANKWTQFSRYKDEKRCAFGHIEKAYVGNESDELVYKLIPHPMIGSHPLAKINNRANGEDEIQKDVINYLDTFFS